MSDALNLLMLICACIGAIGFGLFSAYGMLKFGFWMMRPAQPLQAVKTQPEAAQLL